MRPLKFALENNFGTPATKFFIYAVNELRLMYFYGGIPPIYCAMNFWG